MTFRVAFLSCVRSVCITLIYIDEAYIARYGTAGFVLSIVLELVPVAHGFFLVLRASVAHVSVYVRCILGCINLTLRLGVSGKKYKRWSHLHQFQ